ncbi:MAG: hypothetical protein IPO98_08350 [Saprospiraceae bacterium]|nr:hypothetical protein [Saprospiraceae bacterium]
MNSEGTRLNLKDAARVAASSHHIQKEEEIINTKLNDIKLSTKIKVNSLKHMSNLLMYKQNSKIWTQLFLIIKMLWSIRQTRINS